MNVNLLAASRRSSRIAAGVIAAAALWTVAAVEMPISMGDDYAASAAVHSSSEPVITTPGHAVARPYSRLKHKTAPTPAPTTTPAPVPAVDEPVAADPAPVNDPAPTDDASAVSDTAAAATVIVAPISKGSGPIYTPLPYSR